jgi:hypothetical protein
VVSCSQPNMLIVPPQLLLYMATAPEEKINFGTAGPAGPERFEAGVAGYEARAFRGLGVFSSTPVRLLATHAAMEISP